MAKNLIQIFIVSLFLTTYAHCESLDLADIPKPDTILSIEKTLLNKKDWLPIHKDEKSMYFTQFTSTRYFSDDKTLDYLASVNVIEKKLETGKYSLGEAIYNCDNKTFKIKNIKVFDLLGNIHNFGDSEFFPIKNSKKHERIADFVCPSSVSLPNL